MTRLGSNRPTRVDVRLIVATDVGLEQALCNRDWVILTRVKCGCPGQITGCRCDAGATRLSKKGRENQRAGDAQPSSVRTTCVSVIGATPFGSSNASHRYVEYKSSQALGKCAPQK